MGVAEFGTIDDNFDNVDWLASIDVSYYTPTKEITFKAIDTLTAIHNIQQTERS